jgi:adenosylhomocysteine nucleosidase
MHPAATVLCTSGLAAEARIARRAGFSVVLGAGDPARTESLVETAAPRADCLISFGVAGALSPRLRSGDVVVSGEVVGASQHWQGDGPFRRRLIDVARSIGATEGPVYGADEIHATRRQKAAAWRETGALVVDLESAIVARIAAAVGIPFLVLRAVADPAHRELPPAALIPLAANGMPNLTRVLAEIIAHPAQIGSLIGLAWETRRGLDALAAPACALGDLLAGPQSGHRLFDVPREQVLGRPLAT